jgi:hypothetical protein
MKFYYYLVVGGGGESGTKCILMEKLSFATCFIQLHMSYATQK